MWLKRLSPKINLFLTILSIVLSYSLVLWQAPKLWYVLLILTVPAIVLFFLSLARWRNVPLEGDRYLNNENANRMVVSAVNPRLRYPLCAHLTVMHANGTTVATKMARTMLRTIHYLVDILLSHERDMQIELIFSPDVVEKHLSKMRRDQGIISGLVRSWEPLNRDYQLIPEAIQVYQVLASLSEELHNNVIIKMDVFCKKMPGVVKRDIHDFYYGKINKVKNPERAEEWRSLIQKLLTEVAPILTGLVQKLRAAEAIARDSLEQLETDWEHDLSFLWQDPLCKPVPNEPRGV